MGKRYKPSVRGACWLVLAVIMLFSIHKPIAEKACSPLNLPYPQSEDIATALEAADMIRSKAVQPKIAMQSLKRRIASKNGRVQMYAIGVSDIFSCTRRRIEADQSLAAYGYLYQEWRRSFLARSS